MPAILLTFACVLLGASSIAAARAGDEQLSIADVVDRDGRAHWPKDFTGPVDVSNYDLVTAPDGEPRFVSQNAGSFVNLQDGWSAFGAARHGCDGAINAMLRMPNGDLILGGAFKVCGGINAQGLIRWDGTRWSAFNQPDALGFGIQVVGRGVLALALRGTDLLVGGEISVGTELIVDALSSRTTSLYTFAIGYGTRERRGRDVAIPIDTSSYASCDARSRLPAAIS